MKTLSFAGTAIMAIAATASLGSTAGAAGRETTLYSFGGDAGRAPVSSLLYANGSLYGTTLGGGVGCPQSAAGCGVVFALNGAGQEGIVHSFRNGLAGPLAGLIQVGNVFFGTTSEKGKSRNGAVFRMNAQGQVAVVHSFAGAPGDGGYPAANLIYAGGTLYGTTAYGGLHDQGTVFSVTPAGSEKIIYSFQGGTDGAHPLSSLVWVDGALYGTTSAGGGVGCPGSGGCGTVFTVSPQGAEKVIHPFGGEGDGMTPMAGLTWFNKVFYGTTASGGDTGNGTVFSITPQGAETIVYAFQGGNDGAAPFAALTVAGPALYGTTFEGGNGTCGGEPKCGTVFKFIPSVAEHVIYRFQGGDGAFPVSPVLFTNGLLYGTTSAGGGAENAGTLYDVTP